MEDFFIERKGSNVYISGVSERPIKIPSAMYALNGKPYVFIAQTTAPFPDTEETEKIRAIFDGIEQKMGQCYTNAETLQAALRAEGIDARTYVGWQFVGPQQPVHHAIVAVENHVLDFNIRGDLLMPVLTQKAPSLDELRKITADFMIELKKKPNSEIGTFGQMDPYSFIVCSECKPMKGLELYKKLIKAYPKHPARNEHNGKGLSRTQEIYFDKLSNQ